MTPSRAAPLLEQLIRSALRALALGGRSLLAIVQGGMGVGASAHRLAGSVAAHGAVGTISSVDLRRHHPDLMHRSSEQELAQASDDEVVELTSVAGLPARAVLTPWLRSYLKAEPRLQSPSQPVSTR